MRSLDMLEENPRQCEWFVPNRFKPLTCSDCRCRWNLHRGIISDADLAICQEKQHTENDGAPARVYRRSGGHRLSSGSSSSENTTSPAGSSKKAGEVSPASSLSEYLPTSPEAQMSPVAMQPLQMGAVDENGSGVVKQHTKLVSDVVRRPLSRSCETVVTPTKYNAGMAASSLHKRGSLSEAELLVTMCGERDGLSHSVQSPSAVTSPMIQQCAEALMLRNSYEVRRTELELKSDAAEAERQQLYSERQELELAHKNFLASRAEQEEEWLARCGRSSQRTQDLLEVQQELACAELAAALELKNREKCAKEIREAEEAAATGLEASFQKLRECSGGHQEELAAANSFLRKRDSRERDLRAKCEAIRTAGHQSHEVVAEKLYLCTQLSHRKTILQEEMAEEQDDVLDISEVGRDATQDIDVGELSRVTVEESFEFPRSGGDLHESTCAEISLNNPPITGIRCRLAMELKEVLAQRAKYSPRSQSGADEVQSMNCTASLDPLSPACTHPLERSFTEPADEGNRVISHHNAELVVSQSDAVRNRCSVPVPQVELHRAMEQYGGPERFSLSPNSRTDASCCLDRQAVRSPDNDWFHSEADCSPSLPPGAPRGPLPSNKSFVASRSVPTPRITNLESHVFSPPKQAPVQSENPSSGSKASAEPVQRIGSLKRHETTHVGDGGFSPSTHSVSPEESVSRIEPCAISYSDIRDEQGSASSSAEVPKPLGKDGEPGSGVAALTGALASEKDEIPHSIVCDALDVGESVQPNMLRLNSVVEASTSAPMEDGSPVALFKASVKSPQFWVALVILHARLAGRMRHSFPKVAAAMLALILLKLWRPSIASAFLGKSLHDTLAVVAPSSSLLRATLVARILDSAIRVSNFVLPGCALRGQSGPLVLETSQVTVHEVMLRKLSRTMISAAVDMQMQRQDALNWNLAEQKKEFAGILEEQKRKFEHQLLARGIVHDAVVRSLLTIGAATQRHHEEALKSASVTQSTEMCQATAGSEIGHAPLETSLESAQRVHDHVAQRRSDEGLMTANLDEQLSQGSLSPEIASARVQFQLDSSSGIHRDAACRIAYSAMTRALVSVSGKLQKDREEASTVLVAEQMFLRNRKTSEEIEKLKAALLAAQSEVAQERELRAELEQQLETYRASVVQAPPQTPSKVGKLGCSQSAGSLVHGKSGTPSQADNRLKSRCSRLQQDLVAERARVADLENALSNAPGHANPKQRVHVINNLKQQLLSLRKENADLRAGRRSISQNDSSLDESSFRQPFSCNQSPVSWGHAADSECWSPLSGVGDVSLQCTPRGAPVPFGKTTSEDTGNGARAMVPRPPLQEIQPRT